MLSSNKAMFHVGLIPNRWYIDMTYESQKEVAITVCNKNLASDDKVIYEHQIETNFDMLNEIRHTQVFSETVKKNLTQRVKYSQGLGYAKKALNLALENGCENELNKLLQHWIKEKEKEIYNESNKETFQILVFLIRHVQRVLPKNGLRVY